MLMTGLFLDRLMLRLWRLLLPWQEHTQEL
jgi:hypothetical protein